MKNKKGFTLIEVLAVIIILAIILVIIAPKVNEYYKDSVKRKNLQSAYGVRNALNQYYASYTGTFRGYTCEFPDNCSEIKLDGSVPTYGIVSITADGIISGYVRYDNNAFILNDEGVTASEYTTVPGDFFDFSYSTSGEQTFLVTVSGYYKLEVWGAQGGSYGKNGGYGGYSRGVVSIQEGTKLYVNVGGHPSSSTGGYNGGGDGGSKYNARGGGGATHIALKSGLLSSLSSDVDKILIVAGGGGGSDYYLSGSDGGSAGGFVGIGGEKATYSGSFGSYTVSTGGSQLSGGTGGIGLCNGTNGTFGQGGSYCNNHGGGGGAGFYGGGGGAYNSGVVGSGAGGSGYIGYLELSDGVMYCYGCTENSNAGTRTVSTTGSNKDSVNCPNGYSSNPLSNCAKSENGHARITYVGNSL